MLRISAALCVSFYMLGLSGCIAGGVAPGELKLHGKMGWACSIPAGVVGIGLDMACAPVTLTISGIGIARQEAGDDSFFWFAFPAAPGFVLELLVYHAAAGVAYPLNLVAVTIPQEVRMALKTDQEKVSWYLSKLPQVSRSEYEALVRAAGRSFPPPYRRAETDFVAFGRKPKADKKLEAEWDAWRKRGMPSDRQEEAAFVLEYWIMRPDPQYLDFLYGEEGLATIERILGTTESEVTAYYDSHRVRAQQAGVGKWKFWILEHGGVAEIVARRFSEEATHP